MCLDQKLQAKLIILDYKNQNGLVGLGFAYIITWEKKKKNTGCIHWLQKHNMHTFQLYSWQKVVYSMSEVTIDDQLLPAKCAF